MSVSNLLTNLNKSYIDLKVNSIETNAVTSSNVTASNVTASNVTSTIINVDSIFENTIHDGVNIEGVVVKADTILFDVGQTVLGHYSESSQSNSLTGIWAVDEPVELTFTKVGRMITMSWSSANEIANMSSSINLVTLIPIEYRPISSITFVLKTRDAFVDSWGSALLTNGGALTIYTTPTSSDFSGTGSSGILSGSVSYH